MGKFKKIEDLKVFNPVVRKDLKTGKPKSVMFEIEDFNDMLIAIETSVIFEINEGKKTMSHKMVENMFKYLDDELAAEDVLASLKEHKKSQDEKGKIIKIRITIGGDFFCEFGIKGKDSGLAKELMNNRSSEIYEITKEIQAKIIERESVKSTE